MSHLKLITFGPPKHLVHCPRKGCTHRASGAQQWEALHQIGHHILRVHVEGLPVPTHDMNGVYVGGQD